MMSYLGVHTKWKSSSPGTKTVVCLFLILLLWSEVVVIFSAKFKFKGRGSRGKRNMMGESSHPWLEASNGEWNQAGRGRQRKTTT